jgi:transposase
MPQSRPCPCDVSDARWALISPTLEHWRRERHARRVTEVKDPVDLRSIWNAILYLNRTGIGWKYLPHDFPPPGTVYYYYAAWRDEGIFKQLNTDLTALARQQAGHTAEPTAATSAASNIPAKVIALPPLPERGTEARPQFLPGLHALTTTPYLWAALKTRSRCANDQTRLGTGHVISSRSPGRAARSATNRCASPLRGFCRGSEPGRAGRASSTAGSVAGLPPPVDLDRSRSGAAH